MLNIADEAYAWLAVVAVPINSAVNPLLYSLTTRPFCHQLQSSIRKRRRSSQESLRDTLGKDGSKMLPGPIKCRKILKHLVPHCQKPSAALVLTHFSQNIPFPATVRLICTHFNVFTSAFSIPVIMPLWLTALQSRARLAYSG